MKVVVGTCQVVRRGPVAITVWFLPPFSIKIMGEPFLCHNMATTISNSILCSDSESSDSTLFGSQDSMKSVEIFTSGHVSESDMETESSKTFKRSASLENINPKVFIVGDDSDKERDYVPSITPNNKQKGSESLKDVENSEAELALKKKKKNEDKKARREKLKEAYENKRSSASLSNSALTNPSNKMDTETKKQPESHQEADFTLKHPTLPSSMKSDSEQRKEQKELEKSRKAASNKPLQDEINALLADPQKLDNTIIVTILGKALQEIQRLSEELCILKEAKNHSGTKASIPEAPATKSLENTSKKGKGMQKITLTNRDLTKPYVTPFYQETDNASTQRNDERNTPLFSQVAGSKGLRTSGAASHQQIPPAIHRPPANQNNNRAHTSMRVSENPTSPNAPVGRLPTLLVRSKPPGTLTAGQLKQQLETHIHPKRMQIDIHLCKEIPNNGLRILFKNEHSIDKFVKILQENPTLKVLCESKRSEGRKPHIILYDIEPRLPTQTRDQQESAILEKLADSNGFQSTDLRVLYRRPGRNNKEHWIIIVEPRAFKTFSNGRYIAFGLGQFHFKEIFEPTLCFKCLKFGHLQGKCDATQQACSRCEEFHFAKDCPKTNPVCRNCVENNKISGNKHMVRHTASSKHCPAYLRELEAARRRTLYV